MNSSKNMGTYKIPPDLMAELDDIPDSNYKGHIDWTPEQDAVILAMYKKKLQQQFLRWFQKKYGVGSIPTIRARYHLLTETTKKKIDYRGPDEYKLLAPE